MSFEISKEEILRIAKENSMKFTHKDVFTFEEYDYNDENVEYHKYDIDLLGVPLDAKFIIKQVEDDKPDLKIDAIGNTIDGDIIMFVKEIKN